VFELEWDLKEKIEKKMQIRNRKKNKSAPGPKSSPAAHLSLDPTQPTPVGPLLPFPASFLHWRVDPGGRLTACGWVTGVWPPCCQLLSPSLRPSRAQQRSELARSDSIPGYSPELAPRPGVRGTQSLPLVLVTPCCC
jgi:hypothetical protein